MYNGNCIIRNTEIMEVTNRKQNARRERCDRSGSAKFRVVTLSTAYTEGTSDIYDEYKLKW